MATSAANAKTSGSSSERRQQAERLFADSLVWDMVLPWNHICNMHDSDIIFPEYRRVGIKFVSLTVSAADWMIEGTVRHIATVRRDIRERSDRLALCTSVPQIRKAVAEGKLAIGLNFQETLGFHDSLAMVEVYHTLGVRHVLLAYNQKNLVADGCAERTDSGLSRFGVALVKEMIKIGILVDGSHTGYRSTMDAIELCGAAGVPFVFSHSNPDALVRHYRNIKDDQIKACIATGGMVGINGVGEFIGDAKASTEAFFRCIDYVVQMAGPEYVGIGLDYVRDVPALGAWVRRNASMWPDNNGKPLGEHEFVQPRQLVDAAEMMLAHGYSPESVKGILGENWARVCGRVWR